MRYQLRYVRTILRSNKNLADRPMDDNQIVNTVSAVAAAAMM